MNNTHIHHDNSASIHRIPALGKGHCSAYLNSDGVMVDAEQITSLGRSRPIKKDAALWNHVKGRAEVIYKAAISCAEKAA